MSKIHSSWNHCPGGVLTAGWKDTYFVDEHPQRTQWSRHTTVGMPPSGMISNVTPTYMVYESWVTMPKGLRLSKWIYYYADGTVREDG